MFWQKSFAYNYQVSPLFPPVLLPTLGSLMSQDAWNFMRSRRTINSPCIIDLSYGLVHNNKDSYSLAKISRECFVWKYSGKRWWFCRLRNNIERHYQQKGKNTVLPTLYYKNRFTYIHMYEIIQSFSSPNFLRFSDTITAKFGNTAWKSVRKKPSK